MGLCTGALGFHNLNARDLPFGCVFILDANDWTVTLSHEVLELIIDPTVNIFVPGPDPRSPANLVLHTYEVCDAVERTIYRIDEIDVSNFLTPSYFTIGDAAVLATTSSGWMSLLLVLPGIAISLFSTYQQGTS